MNWRSRLKIGPRMMLGFAAVLLIAAAIVALSLRELTGLGNGLAEIAGYNQKEMRLLADLERATLERAIAARNLVLLTDPQRRQAELDHIAATKKQIDAALQELATMVNGSAAASAEDRSNTVAAQEFELRYWPVAEGVVKLSNAGQRDAAIAKLTNECIPLLADVKARLGQFAALNQKESESSVQALRKSAGSSSLLMLGLGAAAVLIGSVLAWLIQRSVVEPLRHASAAVRRVAEGDLTQRIEAHGRDEVAAMLADVGQMQQRLRELVGNIRSGVDSVNTASTEIATGNHDLSERTEQTASNLQQAASSMEQLTGTVKQSADAARTANQLASSAASVAARGGDVVSQVVTTMDEINASSKKISDIIGVIDGIAFQTNILALNAAVEAARAGEQGRGFAVVASEVRSLAQRSADAAKEIKALIGASVDRVESGSKLVADAGSTMSEIVASVQRVSDIIGEISAASSEQSDGIGQVNVAVVQLDQMTQQNAALVEQSAAAAESLKDQAKRLAEMMSTFRLDDSRTVAPAFSVVSATHAKPATRPAIGKVPSASKAKPAAARPSSPMPAMAAAAPADGDWETF